MMLFNVDVIIYPSPNLDASLVNFCEYERFLGVIIFEKIIKYNKDLSASDVLSLCTTLYILVICVLDGFRSHPLRVHEFMSILSSTHPGTAVGGARAGRWKQWLGPCLDIAKLHFF